MKSSLWIIIALVTGIVGFLMGYSISSFSGTRRGPEQPAEHAAASPTLAPAAQAPAADAAPAAPAPAGGYGAAAPAPKASAAPPPRARPAPKADAGGYGSAPPEQKAGAGGYGAPEPPRPPPQQASGTKPSAAGY